MKKLFTFGALFYSFSCAAQIQIDLSKKITLNLSGNPEKIKTIELDNALTSSGNYTINTTIKHIPQSPLVIPTEESRGENEAANEIPEACRAIESLTVKLDAEADETNIPGDKENLKNAIKDANVAICKSYIDIANIEINKTAITIPVDITIGKNDELDIIVTRGDKKWTYTYKNEQPNHWTTYYGFTYIPDILVKFPNYYANEQTAGGYVITKMNGGNKNVFQNVSPTAMFTYRCFDKKPDAIFKFGITAGIFYNTDILGALIGPSLVIGDNVTLNTGISFVQKYKLKGQYKDGQSIENNLDFDQLHDKIWTYDMFISIGFNIPNLFSKKSSSSTPTNPNTTSTE